MDSQERTLRTEDIFKGKIVKLRVDTVTLPGGAQSTREIIEHAPAIAIVAIDDEKQVLMVRQYRKAVEQFLLEIPAGILEANEEPLVGAQRELVEETGYRAKVWKEIASFYTTPGFTNEKIHLFLAQGLIAGDSKPDEDEFIEVVKIPLNEAWLLVQEGQIVDAKTIIGIQYAWAVKED